MVKEIRDDTKLEEERKKARLCHMIGDESYEDLAKMDARVVLQYELRPTATATGRLST